MRELGRRIRARRAKLRLSQAVVVARVGKSRAWLVALEPTAQPPAAVVTPSPSTAPAPTASLPAAATASPAIDPALAGTQYLAATKTVNKAFDALNRKYRTFGTLKQARTYYKKAAKLERAFADTVRKIVFPLDMAGDVRSLLQKDAALEALYIEAGSAKSLYQVNSLGNAMDRASRATVAASNLVRADLGLPSVPG